jgi:hypothetical protein
LPYLCPHSVNNANEQLQFRTWLDGVQTRHAAARLALALANNVNADVLALQMTNNTRKNNPDMSDVFIEQNVFSIAKHLQG